VLRVTDRPSLARGGRVLEAGFDCLQCLSLAATQGGEEGRGVVEVCIAGRRRDRISLFEQRRGGSELSSEYNQASMVGEPKGKGDEGAALPSEADSATGELVPGLVVPQVWGDSPRIAHLAPDEAMLPEQHFECLQRLPERPHACRVPVGEPGHEAVQEEIERPWRL